MASVLFGLFNVGRVLSSGPFRCFFLHPFPRSFLVHRAPFMFFDVGAERFDSFYLPSATIGAVSLCGLRK